MADIQGANDKIELLRGLRQNRFFQQQPVPDEVLDNILEVARWTGSAGNTQPWEFVVIRDSQKLRQLGMLAPNTRWLAAGAPAGIILVMHENEYKDALAVSYDEGRLTERIMLAAAAQGLGAALAWFSGDSPTQVKQILGIPAEGMVRTVIAMGYPGEPPATMAGPGGVAGRGMPQSGRKPLTETVHNEKY